MNDYNNIFKIDSMSGPGVSLSKVLLVFYLLITTNFTNNFVSKQLKSFFEENRLAQHTIAIISLLVLITSIGGVVDTKNAVMYTIIGYVWFLFTTKLDIHWNIAIILILLSGYLFENNLDNKAKLLDGDKVLTDDEKKGINNYNNKVKMFIVGGAMTVTIIGTLLYSNKKQVQYGGGYDPLTFLLY
jgi:hypothetical protein